jgi:hypothetical protein
MTMQAEYLLQKWKSIAVVSNGYMTVYGYTISARISRI